MNEHGWDQAIERLEQVWGKRKAEWCAWGAIRCADLDELAALEMVAEIATELFPGRATCLDLDFMGALGTVAAFNDHPDTTVDDVIAVFEKARARAAEVGE